VNSPTTSNYPNKTFEWEFSAEFPEAKDVIFRLWALNAAYVDSLCLREDGYQEIQSATFRMMTDEQLRWVEKVSHFRTPYGEACRTEIMERALLCGK